MRAVIQRVSKASVDVAGEVRGRIGRGLLVYVGVEDGDQASDVEYAADKVRHLRIFSDQDGKMNLDVGEVRGGVLVVSAFTVQADARRGRRPTFEAAARPDQAEALYEQFCNLLSAAGLEVERGSFGDDMKIESTNDGPICILLDSRRRF